MGNFFLPVVVMIKNWGRVLLGGMSIGGIQFLDSQIYFPVILTLCIWNIFFDHDGMQKTEKKKSRNILER